MSKQEPWYVASFQSDYLKIYAHRTDEAAQDEINQVIHVLNVSQGSQILDLCCGNGRHSRALAHAGFKVTGIDLSEELLAVAREKAGSSDIRYVQADVRSLPFKAEFDYVLNLFTSFGYFEDAAENAKVFDSIYQSLKTGGIFLIDYFNPASIRAHLVPESKRVVDNLHIVEKRRIEGPRVIKNIEVIEKGIDNYPRHYVESVYMFELDEMKKMLTDAGLQVSHVYGSFACEAYDPILSPRMILVGKK